MTQKTGNTPHIGAQRWARGLGMRLFLREDLLRSFYLSVEWWRPELWLSSPVRCV
jgi:hypothetical protein